MGEDFPSPYLKASLGWTSPRWSSERASPKRDALGDLLCRATLPNILPATSPESAGGFLQRFHHSRCRRRSPDTLIRAPPALDSALAPITRPPKTTLRHLHPSGSFVKSSAHSCSLVDSSNFFASIDHRSARRIGSFSHWWPTIRPQPTWQARDDSPEPHRLPRARTLRLCQLHRQHLAQRKGLAARKGPVNSPVTAQCQPSRRDASD